MRTFDVVSNDMITMIVCNAYSELLGQAWMKPDKGSRAPHVLLVSKRFNEVHRISVSFQPLNDHLG